MFKNARCVLRGYQKILPTHGIHTFFLSGQGRIQHDNGTVAHGGPGAEPGKFLGPRPFLFGETPFLFVETPFFVGAPPTTRQCLEV